MSSKYVFRGGSLYVEKFKGVKEESFKNDKDNLKMFKNIGVRKAWNDIQALLKKDAEAAKAAKQSKPVKKAAEAKEVE